jgi:prepilin-type N-terminal cleavage/methylation domain-containing protein
MKTNNRGFTLIEVMIVIAIIGVLASIVISISNTGRIKSRNSVRIQELRQMQNALELYYINHGQYPISQGPIWAGRWAEDCYMPGFVIPELVTEKLFPGIKDPVLACPGHDGYSYGSNGRDYKLIAHSEAFNGVETTLIDPATDGGVLDSNGMCIIDGNDYQHFGVWSSGGKCWLENWICDIKELCLTNDNPPGAGNFN